MLLKTYLTGFTLLGFSKRPFLTTVMAPLGNCPVFYEVVTVGKSDNRHVCIGQKSHKPTRLFYDLLITNSPGSQTKSQCLGLFYSLVILALNDRDAEDNDQHSDQHNGRNPFV